MSRVPQLKAYKTIAYLVLAASAAALAGCQVGNSAPVAGDERAAILVDVDMAVASTEYQVQREFIGRVEATRQSQVGFELGGELRRVRVDEGDTVRAGDVLAELDTARLEARLAEAQAAFEQAESAQALAIRTFERRRDAAVSGGISEQAVDEAEDAANATTAGLAAARARLNSVVVDLDKSMLTAPYDAVVIARNVDEGNIVSAGLPVLHLQELAAPEVRIGISGELAAEIAAGDKQPVTIGSQQFDATVRAVLPVRNPQTRTVDVLLKLPEGAMAYTGDLARIAVEQPVMEPGFWLPVTALAEGSRGLWTVNVVLPIETGVMPANGATHYIEQRSVEVLYKEQSVVFVRGALAEGDRYVTSGLQRIVPNQHVRIAGAVASTSASASDHE
ncbi:MAG: efflux RND transporter periplasmic adaptor subunit [Woeseiaceae bacterium]|nr:efflux RND transporter periplasmic adaptor subunit [Woeseiaceae bacterium]